MKWVLLVLGLFLCVQFTAQDKIYLLDGQRHEGKVSEISSEKITYLFNGISRVVAVDLVLLIEFSSGRTQVFHAAQKDIYRAKTIRPEREEDKHRVKWQNEFYINTLALYNADVSLYYEYRLKTKQIGLGFLGTYNFNAYATAPNYYVAALSNGKKLYDAGAFISFYTRNQQATLQFYYGLMFKYTAFNFTAVNEDSVYANNSASVLVSYEPASGSQLSTLLNLGIHSDITETVFIKSSFALGFFVLKGVYKEQLNTIMSNPQNGYISNYSVLPKASLGFSVGFKF
jgi:hypothetical protein